MTPAWAAVWLNIPLAANALILARRRPGAGGLDFWLGAAVWAAALVTAEMLFLGVVLGRLGFAGALALCLGVLVLSWRPWRSWRLAGPAPTDAVLNRGALNHGAAPQASPAAAAALALAGLAVVALVTLGLILPPWGFDELMYHLYLPAAWLKEGRIGPFPAYDYLAYWVYYPAGGELLFLWALLTGSDTWAGLIQLGAALAGAAAAAGLAQSLGAGRGAAVIGGGLFFFTPMVLIQAKTAYVDVLFSAFYLTAAHFIVRSSLTGRRDLLLPAGMAAGLMTGIKGNGPLYLMFLGLLLIPGWLRARGGCGADRRTSHQTVRRTVCRAMGDLIRFVPPALLIGGWWYLRNWRLTGNPVYPFSLDLPGGIAFPGPLDTRKYLDWGQDLFVAGRWGWLLYPLTDQAIGRPFYALGTGLGPQFLAFALPALLLAFPVLFARRGTGPAWMLWLQMPLGLAAFFWLQPFKDGRYLLPLVGPAAALLGLVLGRLPCRARELAGWGLVLCYGYSLAASLPEIMPAGNRFALRELRDRRAVLDSHQLYGIGWGPMGMGWFYADRLTGDGAAVAYDGLSLPYPLFGRRLQNRVVYVPPADSDAGRWRDRLREAGVGWLYLTDDSGGWDLARGRPDLFEPVYQRSGYALFRIPDDAASAPPPPDLPPFPGPPAQPRWVSLWLSLAAAAAAALSGAGLWGVWASAARRGNGTFDAGGIRAAVVAPVFLTAAFFLLNVYLDKHRDLWNLAGLWWKFLMGWVQ